MQPFLLGPEPTLPDFHLFHVLELGKTFSKIFDMPFLNLLEGDVVLQQFYEETIDYGNPAKAALQALFGHEV